MKPKKRNKIKNGADSYKQDKCYCGKPSGRGKQCPACTALAKEAAYWCASQW